MTVDVKDFSPCPNLSKRVRESSGEEGFAYWCQLGYSQMTKDHSLCNEDECHANDLDPEKYVTKHTRDGCECPFLGPSPTDLILIYEAGSFPVVSLTTRNGLTSVDIRPYEPGLQYVAISHALSDGRGNPNSEALPTCQLKQINMWVRNSKFVNGLTADIGWFWMDTLCVPSHLSIHKKYDSATRVSFQQSTEKALHTLVIDSDIELLSRTSTYGEAFIRISLSSWSSRMWTLQEAVLTPKVVLQIMDATTTFEEVIKMHDESRMHIKVPTEQFLIYSDLRKYLSGDSAGYVARSVSHLATLRIALRNRRTSRNMDKSLIVANLLGLDFTNLPEATLSRITEQHSDFGLGVLEDETAP